MRDIHKIAEELEQALLNNERATARRLFVEELEEIPLLERVDRVLTPILAVIGEKWEKGEVALSQVYLSAKLSEEIISGLMMESGERRMAGPKVASVCLEDYHLLGIHVVSMVVRSSGLMVIDYGRLDLVPLVDKVCQDKVEYLLVSTLMLRSALKVKRLREMLEERNCHVCIIVGGAPFRFDASLCDRVEADFTSSSPVEAMEFMTLRESRT
jgi:methanogenic corrinoid protein MtbC1